jgi:class 3 adenylate cyclase
MQDAGRLRTEIAHIVVADRVGSSQLTLETKARLDAEMREAISGFDAIRESAGGDSIVADSGDGLVLIMFGDPARAAECAEYLHEAVAAHTDVPLRIGVHSGPVVRRIDVTGRPNAIGPGIDKAQRVMTCADGTGIVVSDVFAETLRALDDWRDRLEDLGDCAVKHGEVIHVYRVRPQPIPASAPLTHADSPRIDSPRVDAPGGAVPLDSRYYIVRDTDEEFQDALLQRHSLVLVKGPRQIGKTSLLARALARADRTGSRIVLTDFQAFSSGDFSSDGRFYRALEYQLASQLGLDPASLTTWNEWLGANSNLERFVQDQILAAVPGHVIWAMDEVDRMFVQPFASDFFGMLRSWHNRRALRAEGPWSRLTIAIAYATEAHLFITDLNQSPFNVGTRLRLADFSLDETEELNRRYESPLGSVADLERFWRLTGGHPYLCRRGLDVLIQRECTFADLEAIATDDEGPFGDQLRRMLVGVTNDSELVTEVQSVLRGSGALTPEGFYRLRSAGVLAGDGPRTARMRSELYGRYLIRQGYGSSGAA